MTGETVLGSLMVGVWVMYWLLAGIVYFSAPSRSSNRLLSLVLFLEGGSLGAFALMVFRLGEGGVHQGFLSVHIVFWIPVAWLYIAFISQALASPLARFAARPLVMGSLGVYTSVMIVLYFTTGQHLWSWDPPRLWVVAFSMLTITGVYALFAAVQAAWRSRGVARVQARAFVMAFGARDGLFLLFLLTLPWYIANPMPQPHWLAWNIALGTALVVFATLLTYGILKTQLFDIDLKLKLTIRKSTLAGIFVLVFFVVAQTAQAFLTTVYGWALGGIAAGLLFFAIAPLQRFAEKVSDKAMPGVSDTPGYLERRKEEVYRVQLQELLADGHISVKERKALFRLQEILEIDAASAAQLEKEMLDGMESSRDR